MAECVLAEPGASAGNDRDNRDEVNGLVERASPHLTSEECRQLQAAMAARKHLFAKGKGDLGRTDIVQHQIHTGDQPAVKQRVRRYPVEAGRERPAPLGGHLAGVTRGQGAMAPVGTVIPGRQSTTPTVPRVGRTGMAAPVGRPGGSTRQSSPAVPWRDDQRCVACSGYTRLGLHRTTLGARGS